MKIPEFSVNRRVTVAMMAAIVVVVGMLTFTRLGLDLLPDISYPIISVMTTYPGVSSEDVEALVTKPVEEMVASVGRVKSVKSISQEGVSVVMVEFDWGTNLDFAAQDIRDRVGLYRDVLPEDVSDPLVVKFDVSQMPILVYSVTGGEDTQALRKILTDVVKDRLERLDGVASAPIMGGRIREFLVEIDRTRLEAYGLTLEQVIGTLRAQNINTPAGHIDRGYTEFLVRVLGEYEALDEIRNTVVGSSGRPSYIPIYLKDVAEVKDTHREIRSYSRTQGAPNVMFMVMKQSGANSVTVSDQVTAEIERVKSLLPPNVQFYPLLEQADMIKRILSRTGNNALVGGLLAILSIFFFLRSGRPTLTIALAIPLSLIATFIAIYVAGFSLNLMTMAGLALGVGMLVDNAVVVIENIFRHLEEGQDRSTAARVGASEVGMAITASTLTTIAVFFPMMLGGGIAGKLSRGLALTISFALLASLFTALTLVPMMASLLFKARTLERMERRTSAAWFIRLREQYRKALRFALAHRKTVVLAAGGAFIGSLVVLKLFVGAEFMPPSDVDFLQMMVTMPVGTSLRETDRVVRGIEEALSSLSEIRTVSTFCGMNESQKYDVAYGTGAAGVNEAQVFVRLYSKREGRKRSTEEIMDDIRSRLPQIEGAKFIFADMSRQMMGGTGLESPVNIKIFGKDLATLKEVAERAAAVIGDVEGIRDVDTSLRQGKPELLIRIDRDKAARYGLTVGKISASVKAATLGMVATRQRVGGEEVNVRVRFRPSDRASVEDIESIPIAIPGGAQIPLRQIASITQGEGPVKITREDQGRKVSVTANIVGRDAGGVNRDIQRRLSGILLPTGYFIEFGGEYKQMRETFITLGGALALAILLVYMVMASQFESLSHPFTIMFTMPLSLIGVVLAFLITGKTISLPSFMGLIMLSGIVVNNGIVLVDYVNQLRSRGMEMYEALIQAGVIRLRPILITAITTMLGMLPMAISTSEGAEMRAPMAITVIGGLFMGTILTLIIIPVVYSMVDRISFATGRRIMGALHGEKAPTL